MCKCVCVRKSGRESVCLCACVSVCVSIEAKTIKIFKLKTIKSNEKNGQRQGAEADLGPRISSWKVWLKCTYIVYVQIWA